MPRRSHAAALFLFSNALTYAQTPALTGAANFRDIGGYPTQGGHKIKQGVLYRSGELSGLTPSDGQTLANLHLQYEIDLRTDSERAANPSQWGDSAPRLISISVGQPAAASPMTKSQLDRMSQLKTAADAKLLMQQATARIAVDGAAEIGQVLQRLAANDLPALLHCTAGKDRTGVTVAILMTILGASRDDVYREYLRSNESVQAQIDRQQARAQSGHDSIGLGKVDPSALRVLMGTAPENLDASFAAIDAKYGSFAAYITDGLHLTPAQIQSLRNNLLEQ